jgi:hypothetical protein
LSLQIARGSSMAQCWTPNNEVDTIFIIKEGWP